MLSIQLSKDDGIVFIEPSGPLSMADFERLSREVDVYLGEKGSVNGLLIHAASFPGWEDFGGFVHHIKFVKEHHRRIRRIALVSDSKLLMIAPAFAKHFGKTGQPMNFRSGVST
jgi:hypothetical protein